MKIFLFQHGPLHSLPYFHSFFFNPHHEHRVHHSKRGGHNEECSNSQMLWEQQRRKEESNKEDNEQLCHFFHFLFFFNWDSGLCLSPVSNFFAFTMYVWKVPHYIMWWWFLGLWGTAISFYFWILDCHFSFMRCTLWRLKMNTQSLDPAIFIYFGTLPSFILSSFCF